VEDRHGVRGQEDHGRDVGITTFDTADAYANSQAETVLGEALKGERRESLEILTKVCWAHRTEGARRPRAVPQAHHGVDQRITDRAANRLRRRVPGASLRLRNTTR
jgi:aryl-alcohol dehydrogenase-like predicted oxidoreductase